MSTRELALNILNELSEEQLAAFVTLFGGELPNTETQQAIKEIKKGGGMTCFFCKDSMEDTTTTHVVEIDERIIIIKHVPCHKCKQCGEVVYNATVVERLEEDIQNADNENRECCFVQHKRFTSPNDRNK